MILRGLLLIIILFGGSDKCFSMTPAKLAQEGKYEDAIEAYKKALEESKDNMAKAVLHKELGDLFGSRGDFKSAAGEYVKALSLSQNFSENDRLQMAIYMSWGKRLKEAMAELQFILRGNPENSIARINFARVLSWSGQLHESIKEIDKVLETHPNNKDALLVKANALRWQGHFKKAIIIYRGVLEKEEDYDSRLGLTYAYLSAGDIKAAKESKKFLRPQYSYQEKDLRQLNLDMDKVIKPNFGGGYSYYDDSDDNRLYRYSLSSGFWVDNWKLDFNYRHIDAKDNTRNTRAEEFFLKIYSKPKEFFGIGGGLGLVQFKNNTTADFLTWNIKADVNMLNGVAGLTIAREGFTDTAQLITNEIRITNLSLSLSQKLTDRFSIFGAYSYRDYSDDNKANDFQLTPSYSIYTKNPTINIGYRFRYLNFNRQSGSGYFDPNDFISHQIFTSLYLEKDKFYIYLEPYGGYQSFRRYGDSSSGFFGGGYGTLGFNLSKNFALEVNAEGGNYALGATAGFRYYLVGFSLKIIL
ncbi:MAG: hypothetical protein QME78_03930 [Thermodesulfobacteriota bacterium]|nr:hypothetical protein [Thermodesulfobacteriota bacterium]